MYATLLDGESCLEGSGARSHGSNRVVAPIAAACSGATASVSTAGAALDNNAHGRGLMARR